MLEANNRAWHSSKNKTGAKRLPFYIRTIKTNQLPDKD